MTRRFHLPGILLLALLLFLPLLSNGFTNWDDEIYILNNPLIRDLTPRSLAAIFATPEYMGNYHPVTLAAYAVERAAAGGHHAWLFHAVSLLLHLICTALACLFVVDLTGDRRVAALTALLFAIHPLHVEPVAWASGQKELLAACFSLASLIAWLRAPDGRGGWYWIALACFAVALLSKAVAAVLPQLLLLVDRHKGRSTPLPRLIPFFALAAAAGAAAIIAQHASGALGNAPALGPMGRIAVGSYGLLWYIVKLIVPTGLSALYFYPPEAVAAGSLPAVYYGAVAVLLLSAVVLVRAARASKLTLLCAGFFTITLLPVLQIIPVGRAPMADRYVYLPSLAFFILLSTWILALMERPGWRRPLTAALILSGGILCYATLQREPVWKDGVSLWTDVMRQAPDDPGNFNYRGEARLSAGDLRSALSDFDRAIALKPGYTHALVNRGNIMSALGRYADADADFTAALAADPAFSLAYYNRANVLAKSGDRTRALADYDAALRCKPDYAEAYFNRGVLFLTAGDTLRACSDFHAAAALHLPIADTVSSLLCR